MSHLSGSLQQIKCFCHFFRLHQCIRSVKKQDIQIISTQPAERFLYRLQNMFFGKVIHHTRYNPAFRLQDDIFSAKFCLLEYTSEQRFACPFSINIRMIKKMNSQFQTGMDILIHLCLIHSLNTHTSSCNYRNFQHTFSKHLPSHHVPPF